MYSSELQAKIDRFREAMCPWQHYGLPIEEAVQWIVKMHQEYESEENLKRLAEIAARVEEARFFHKTV